MYAYLEGESTNFFGSNKVKGYIFKFVWLQGICKSKMAGFKYVINKIDMKHAGQCYLIRNREEGAIGANVASYFPRKSTKLQHKKNMMAHELARRTASMFDDRGAMNVAKTKLFLMKTNRKVDLARRQTEGGWMCSTVGRAIDFMRN